MKVLVFYLKKTLDDRSFKQYIFIIFTIFAVLLTVIYLTLLMPMHFKYNKQQAIMQNLLSEKMRIFKSVRMSGYEKIPKQNLIPKNNQALQDDIITVLNNSGFDHYEIKPAGSEIISDQCLLKFSINAKAQFKSVLKFLRNLRSGSIFIRDFAINKASENGLECQAVLLGFCGEFCVCQNPA